MKDSVYFGPRIVVGVDGSANSQIALRWAVEEAKARHASIEVVYVWHVPNIAYDSPGYLPFAKDEIEKTAQGILDEALAGIDLGETKVFRRVMDGSPAQLLIDVAAEPDVTTVVVGSRGHTGIAEMLLGSVSHRLSHHCQKPLVTVPGSWSQDSKTDDRRAIVGVDGSAGAARALAWAIGFAGARGGSVEAVMVWPTPCPVLPPHLSRAAIAAGEGTDLVATKLDEAVAKVPHHGVRVDRRVVQGHPSEALASAAASADLLVVGGRGLGRVHEVISGSVSHGCLHKSQIPVVIVPESR